MKTSVHVTEVIALVGLDDVFRGDIPVETVARTFVVQPG